MRRLVRKALVVACGVVAVPVVLIGFPLLAIMGGVLEAGESVVRRFWREEAVK